MAKLRPCKYCGGFHRKQTSAKRCFNRHTTPAPWSFTKDGIPKVSRGRK